MQCCNRCSESVSTVQYFYEVMWWCCVPSRAHAQHKRVCWQGRMRILSKCGGWSFRFPPSDATEMDWSRRGDKTTSWCVCTCVYYLAPTCTLNQNACRVYPPETGFIGLLTIDLLTYWPIDLLTYWPINLLIYPDLTPISPCPEVLTGYSSFLDRLCSSVPQPDNLIRCRAYYLSTIHGRTTDL